MPLAKIRNHPWCRMYQENLYIKFNKELQDFENVDLNYKSTLLVFIESLYKKELDLDILKVGIMRESVEEPYLGFIFND